MRRFFVVILLFVVPLSCVANNQSIGLGDLVFLLPVEQSLKTRLCMSGTGICYLTKQEFEKLKLEGVVPSANDILSKQNNFNTYEDIHLVAVRVIPCLKVNSDFACSFAIRLVFQRFYQGVAKSAAFHFTHTLKSLDLLSVKKEYLKLLKTPYFSRGLLYSSVHDTDGFLNTLSRLLRLTPHSGTTFFDQVAPDTWRYGAMDIHSGDSKRQFVPFLENRVYQHIVYDGQAYDFDKPDLVEYFIDNSEVVDQLMKPDKHDLTNTDCASCHLLVAKENNYKPLFFQLAYAPGSFGRVQVSGRLRNELLADIQYIKGNNWLGVVDD